ncbi:5410_t:CDS:2, partial [Dentiscutata heterogama]
MAASNNSHDSYIISTIKSSYPIIKPLASVNLLTPVIEPSNIESLFPVIEPSNIKPLSPIIASSSNSTNPKNRSDIDLFSDIKDASEPEDINDRKLWPNSVVKSLLIYLSDHINDYQLKKNQFYYKAALYFGKGKTGLQVATKIRWLINKYMKENTNKTRKAVSKWIFFTEMNKIFGNRENVNPKYIIDSMGKPSKNTNQSEKDHSLKRKKYKLSEDDEVYIHKISKSKKIAAQTKKQLYDLEKEKLEFE